MSLIFDGNFSPQGFIEKKSNEEYSLLIHVEIRGMNV